MIMPGDVRTHFGNGMIDSTDSRFFRPWGFGFGRPWGFGFGGPWGFGFGGPFFGGPFGFGGFGFPFWY